MNLKCGHADDCAKVLAGDDGEWRVACDCTPEALRARVKELELTLGRVLRSARPHPLHHPTMTAEWANAQRVLERKS